MPKYSQYDVPDSENMVNLGVGQPSTSDLPIEWFKNTMQKLSNSLDNSEFLQYGSIPGYESVREKLAKWLSNKYYAKEDKLITKNQIFMTNGNTGALQLILNSFVETGDDIIIEDPTYFIAKNMFDEFGLNINSVPMENDGINIGLLEDKILEIMENDKKNLQNKIFLYIIPIHHNPTSITLSYVKREALAKLCKKYKKFYIIADEVYHFLSFSDTKLHLPLADYHNKIISLGSFSKLVAPALRVGWMYQNYEDGKLSLIDGIMKSASLDSSGGINPLGFVIIESAITDGSLDTIIEKNKLILKEKSQLMIEFLNQQIDDIKFIIPEGGYFLWLELSVDTTQFLDFAIKHKVKFHPGIKFGDSCGKFIRLSFSYYDTNDLITGVSRLLEAYTMYKKVKVSICGSTGKLGTLIKNQIEKNKKYYFIEGIKANIKVSSLTDVIIDVSCNLGTYNLINYLLDNKINKPLIVGTTDLSSRTLDSLRIYSINNPVAIISNFSEGIYKIQKIVNELNSIDSEWKFSMIEKHHVNKKDLPSGTAKTLVDSIDRKCPIESIREGDIIGYHELNLESENEEIKIYHNAKSRDIFATGCINYIPIIMKKQPGIYNNFDKEESNYQIYKSLGDTFLISTDIKDLVHFVSKDKDSDYFLLLSNINDSYDWTIYNKASEKLKNKNGNDYLVVSKYLNNKFNIKSGSINFNEFKMENGKYYFEMQSPKEFTLKDEYSNNLSQLINQLTGLNLLGVSKYIIGSLHLIIEIKEDLFDIDSEIISTISSIINTETVYNISFINVLKNNMIRAKYYDINKSKVTDGNAYACTAIFDYYATVNELPYDNDLELTILLNKDTVKTVYKSEKFFISYLI